MSPAIPPPPATLSNLRTERTHASHTRLHSSPERRAYCEARVSRLVSLEEAQRSSIHQYIYEVGRRCLLLHLGIVGEDKPQLLPHPRREAPRQLPREGSIGVQSLLVFKRAIKHISRSLYIMYLFLLLLLQTFSHRIQVVFPAIQGAAASKGVAAALLREWQVYFDTRLFGAVPCGQRTPQDTGTN